MKSFRTLSNIFKHCERSANLGKRWSRRGRRPQTVMMERSKGAEVAKKVSMADVARVAGVSQQTVSRVVNNQDCVNKATRQRILDAMDELGFRPNFAGRSLRGGRYKAIGLGIFDIAKAGNAATLAGILGAARERGYAVSVVEMESAGAARLADAARQLATLPVDGLVLNTNAGVADYDDFVPPAGLPCTLISMREHPTCPTIDSDQYGCSKIVVDYLAARGHREIRHIAGTAWSITAQYRAQGWADALAAHGLEAVEPLVGDWTANSGYELGRILADDHTMTALYAANDQMAAGAIAALRDAGRRVPEDVSVVGVDDSLEGMVPHNQLTTVAFDQRERGRVTFECLLGELDGADSSSGPNSSVSIDGKKPHAIRLPGTLIERATVADLR